MACLVAAALAEIGDAWSLLILRSALLGRTRFTQFREDLRISRGRLSERLDHLVTEDLLSLDRYSETRSEYRLTEKTLDLYPAIMLLRSWGEHWLRSGRPPSQLLVHGCGAPLEAKAICGHCLGEIRACDCDYSPGTGAFDLSELNLRSTRRSSSANAIRKRAESPSANALAVIGDRWTFVILRAMFSGAKRFDDMHAQIGIARNVLADRLRTSETNGLISRRAYQLRPIRHEYELTEMGRDLYPSTLALVDWANRWIARGPKDKVGLRHLSCKRRLALRVICACCREDISPHDVTVTMADGAQATKIRSKAASPTIRTKTEASSPAGKMPRRLAGPVSVRIRNPAMKR